VCGMGNEKGPILMVVEENNPGFWRLLLGPGAWGLGPGVLEHLSLSCDCVV
jgi:hypothetical protein